MASYRIKRSLISSARILVAVKNTLEIQAILKLLFAKVVQPEDFILFLQVTETSDACPERLDKAVLEATQTIDAYDLIPKVTISSLLVMKTEICDGIVQEAKKMKATMVILGNSRNRLISRSMDRFGKQCVRSLPPYCSVLIVRKGKVMHAKRGSAASEGDTLGALLWRQSRLERRVEKEKLVSDFSVCSEAKSGASSSSCSMETILSFSSTDQDFSASSSSSPNTVLADDIDRPRRTSALKKSFTIPFPSTEIGTATRFRYEELSLATRSFASENLVGRGGCCSVYKGILQDGSVVAVKRLLESSSGQREFTREIKVISYIQHPNLVSLLGFCSEDSHRLLVYELLANGSLQHHLHGGDGAESLSWKRRQEIALGAARGLRHLHDLSPLHVIHQDVKSSNILLTDEFEARISDFGFARWSNELTMSTCSGLVGTFGYMAPEYLVHGIASEKTDVYAFGVVLLELISGRSPIDSSLPTKQQSLVHWALMLEKMGATYEMVDSELCWINLHEMKRMMYAALLCIRGQPEERPSMEKVVNLLDTEVFCSEPLLSRHI